MKVNIDRVIYLSLVLEFFPFHFVTLAVKSMFFSREIVHMQE